MEYYKNLEIEDIHYIDDDGFSQIEEWYDIPNYEGLYMLSSLNRVKGLERYSDGRYSRIQIVREKILKHSVSKKNGRAHIVLHKKGISETIGIHVLVARIHIPNPLNLPVVEHLNDIPSDNRAENLMWSTNKQNVINAYERGLIVKRKGEMNGRSKLTKEQVLEIRASNLKIIRLSEKYNMSPSAIASIIWRKTWKHI